MLAMALIAALGPSVTTTRVVARPEPVGVTEAAAAYQRCLYEAIDAQFDAERAAGPTAFSERKVLAACAAVRRRQQADAIAASRTPAGGGPRRVLRKFAALDASVRAIVGHLRARSAGRP